MIETIQKDGKMLYKYSWQPTLEDGKPIGGVQVVEAEKAEDIPAKIAENYNHLYRRNRDLMREKELTAVPPQSGAPKLTPRPLTPEERMRIAREFTDPEKVDTALDLALEAKLGAKPQTVADTYNRTDENTAAIRAAQEASAWRDMHPEFYASQQNCTDLATWIQSRGLTFTTANFQKAYEALTPALETAPPSASEIPPKQEETQAPSRIAGGGESDAQPQPRVPTSVSRRQASGAGTVKADGLTIEQIRRMPTAEYRQKLRDPKFQAQVDALFQQKAR